MLISSLVAFLHFVAAFGIVATVVYEWLTFSRTPTHTEARRIQLSDRWYGIFAGLILVVGYLRVYYFEKGSEFYFSSPFFRVKLLLFLVAAGCTQPPPPPPPDTRADDEKAIRERESEALAAWTAKDAWAYAKQYDIPLLPLYELGYTSIGCEPCTSLPFDPSNPRSGRWQGQKLECGIHIQAKEH